MKTVKNWLAASLAALLGLAMPAAASAQHPAHDTDEMPTSTGLWSRADRYYDPQDMAAARQAALHHGGSQTNLFAMADRFEVQSAGGEEVGLWDAQGWYGGDINKLWLKSEGEYAFAHGELEQAEIQALWSHAITPYFDVQGGVRYDVEPHGLAHAAVGVQGLAPYWLEIDAAAFLSEDGDLAARIEAEYDLHLSQRLILQPRAEVRLAAQDISELDIGSGLSSLEAGARLRYEITREFAPYIGIEWQGSFGETENLVRSGGGDTDRAVFVIGIRAWY